MEGHDEGSIIVRGQVPPCNARAIPAVISCHLFPCFSCNHPWGTHTAPETRAYCTLKALSLWGESTSWGVSISGDRQNLSRLQAPADATCRPSCQPSPLTLLRSSPPLGRSGVLCSEDGFVFSLLLLESLSLMISYCLQNRAITAAERQTG